MKKPYLKKFKVIKNITIWFVDGKYVRENFDQEFTNFGQHYVFHFIPTNEFWIDKEFSPGEEEFFIHHLLVEWHLMRRGMKYKTALMHASKSERAERIKSDEVKDLKPSLTNTTLIKQIHKKQIASYKNGLEVWLVHGELVRDFYFIDFTEGGHDKVYSFVPKNEVWIDDDLSPKERRFVLLHEVHERRLMASGLLYPESHRSASKIEFMCRNKPSLLAKKLRLEITSQ
ncbi:MAG: Uncharacterized protein Athens071416_441 [Parcubacteria group bacterium Athens0714_16]|nr:MAG: Uncharacterized protein Athens071416_441 [Parcubacteria group bacterium Athens0714_16]